MKSLFITATGTGIGKTFVTAAIIHQLRAAGRRVRVLKPVVTGTEGVPPAETDTGVLLAALGEPITPSACDRVSPFRYAAPLAPAMAAAREGRTLDMDALIRTCRAAVQGPEELLLIEGVGGVMVPLSPTLTVLDWMAALAAPALLVTGSYLGTLSHTLTALEVLRQRHIPLAGVIVNETEGATVGLADTARALESYAATPVRTLPRIDGPEPWRRAPDIIGLLAAL